MSPCMLRKLLSSYGSDLSMQVVTYSWRRLPIPVQALVTRLDGVMRKLSEQVPYFGHTLMMITKKN
jgi:hypothetical protein